MTRYPFRNLAFQGGGAKALAYHGALRVLEEEGILESIERVAGTSAGATLATMLSLRLNVAEIMDVYSEFDVEAFEVARSGLMPDRGSQPLRLQRELERLQGSFASVSRLATKFGWNSTEYMYAWMREVLARYCHGNGRATFGQFREWGFRDLHIVATNVSTRRTVVFCADKTPDVAVVDALLMSQAIPIVFEGLQFDGRQFGNGDYYADGGLLLNYPLAIFDESEFALDNHWFVNGVNWESLGCRLYTSADCPSRDGVITNLLTYAVRTFEVLLQAQEVAYNLSRTTQRRTINISDCCVGTTDFHVRADWNDPTYRKLFAAGETAAYAFLETYVEPLTIPVSPTMRLLEHWRALLKRW